MHGVEDFFGDRFDPVNVNELPPTVLLLNKVHRLALVISQRAFLNEALVRRDFDAREGRAIDAG